MRDRIKSERYFTEAIEKEAANCRLYEEALRNRLAEKGEEDIGVRNGYTVLVGSYERLLNMSYSVGADFSECRNYFERLMFCYGKIWNPGSGYIELIRNLSLAVLCGAKKQEVEPLGQRIREKQFDDYLVNFLMRAIDLDWEMDGTDFVFPGIYDELKGIIEESCRQTDRGIEKYLKEIWYARHRECVWYDSHKSKQNRYEGYWSYEAGAVAKICGIEDANLQECAYYPYDFVHFL